MKLKWNCHSYLNRSDKNISSFFFEKDQKQNEKRKAERKEV